MLLSGLSDFSTCRGVGCASLHGRIGGCECTCEPVDLHKIWDVVAACRD